LLTPDVVGRTLKFLGANIECVASWSEVKGQLSSFPCQREDLMGARKFWSSFCTVVVSQWQCNPPQGNEPDLSDIPLLSTMTLPPPVFSMPLSPIFSTLLFLPLFRLDAQAVPFLLAVKVGLLP